MKKEYFYYLRITLAFVIMATFNACKPEPEPDNNTTGSVKVTTSSVSNITETSAKCGGTVTASGYSVGACGLCYSELPNPTINSYITSDQVGAGTFTSTMSGLEPGTKYYVRAYATTSSGTLYGEQKEFTTLGNNGGGDDDNNGGGNGGDDEEATSPTITTNSVSNITFESATCGGNVTDDGGANVTARGVCWSTSQNPTINDNKTSDGSGTGSFTSNLINLNEDTTYYVRAYATNEKGTSYGEQKSFTTLIYEQEPSGYINGYAYVDLGLPSGLKWATYNIGADSPEDYGDYYAWGETEIKSEYTEDNSLTYGLEILELEAQGYIDADGNLTSSHDAATVKWGSTWRMPTEADLEELLGYCTWTWKTQGGKKGYKGTGPNGNSIFLPAAGYRSGSSFYQVGEYVGYWGSTPSESSSNAAFSFALNSSISQVGWHGRDDGRSVRPVSD